MAEEINEGLPNPYDAEKRLMRAFTEAVELGADKQVLAQILNEWQAEHIQINKLQMSLFTPKDDLGKNFLYSLVKIPVPQPISKIELTSLFNISASFI